MRKKSFADMPCPIALSLEHVGDWWNILILRDLFYGLSRFEEFEKSLGIAPSTLTRRLNGLVDSGMVEKRTYSDKPPRCDYLLTERGRDFRSVLLTLVNFGNKHFVSDNIQVQLFDETSNTPVDLVLTDGNTGKPLNVREHRMRYTGPAGKSGVWCIEAGRARRDSLEDASPITPSPSTTGHSQ